MMRLLRACGLREETLCDCAVTGNVERLRELLAEGHATNAPDRTGLFPLQYAVLNGNVEIVRTLLDAGADPEVASSRCESPKTLATRKNRADIVKLFVR